MVGQSTNSKYDVIVVGAGNAALTAALSARQNGARVLVLEKAPQSERGGNSRFSGGIFRFAYDGIEEMKPLRKDLTANDWDLVDVGIYDEDHYLGDLMRVTEGQANRELTQTLIRQSYQTMTWWTWGYMTRTTILEI
jgi:tricarballylate dehydrogenase